MTDLVSRLLEAITAKEAKAEAAKALHVSLDMARRNGKATLYAFLNDNDPSSVLRRCSADRVIVQQHMPAPVIEDGDPPNCGVCIEPGYIGLEFCCDWPRVPWPCPTFRATMSAYGLEVTE